MSTLAESEAAADTLPEPQKQELFEFLAARLGHQATPDSHARVGRRGLPFPLVKGTPGSVINPIKEQLDDY